MIITIDGPSASGKSTIAALLARKLGYSCMSSGLLYRACAYLLLHEYDCASDELLQKSPALIENVMYNPHLKIVCTHETTCGVAHFKQHDITLLCKSEEISHAASLISTIPVVRDTINKYLRTTVNGYDVVVEGRDMGSVVFTEARIKFFLTASVDVRAQRWQMMQATMGQPCSFAQAKKQLEERDARDQTRSIAPLIIPADAIVIDNSELNQEQTVQKMMRYIAQ